jgi:cell division protease FtsH
MNPNFRNFALWAIIALLLIALFNMFQEPTDRSNAREISYSQFLQDVDSGRIREVTIIGDRVSGSYTENGAGFQTYAPVDDVAGERLEDQERQVTSIARPEVGRLEQLPRAISAPGCRSC